MFALKLIPQLIAWMVIVPVVLRGFPGHRRAVTAAAGAGYPLGVAGAFFLSRLVTGNVSLGLIKTVLGISFFFLWVVAVAAIYRSTVRDFPLFRGERFVDTPLCAWFGTMLAGMVAGGIAVRRLPAFDAVFVQLLAVAALALAGVALVFAARSVERILPPSLTVSPSALLAAVVALLLFCASFILRLDLFSPLSMKVMKGTHDFVHQFMESILIPDHIFIRPAIWGYIGILFSKEVGFWGGMVIWFTPVILISLAIQLEPLPSVAHIRQGAQRRRVVAAAIRTRRFRLVTPAVAVIALAAAAYQSRFPSVEYWDPKPLTVTATPAGEIVIPRKGEVDLEDGKLHKYLFKRGEREVRFFVLMAPGGRLTVDLDACAICKPEGYGQAEGTVICYYCKTLIPLDTVGKPGGCNPVPVRFTERDDGVHIDAISLVNNWTTTVQSTTRIKEGGK
jgi:Membrane iron-sulfur containing protein FtrD-like